MEHISYTRQLRTRFAVTLDQIMPLQMGGCSFAAFGGTPQQRTDAAVQSLARYCGRCGILVLLNASDQELPGRMELLLRRLPQSLPDTHQAFRNVPVKMLSWRDYDLLYGLDEAAICQLMLTGENIHGYAGQKNSTLEGLQSYLEIMRYQFCRNSTPFGAYPFNLNLLYQLAQMPYPNLENQVLRYMPDPIRRPIHDVLSKSGVREEVFSLVRSFANRFKRFQVMQGDFSMHSRQSIIQSMRNREILCLRIPNSSSVLLDYIESELAQLSDTGVPFLLLSAELDLVNNTALQRRFLGKPLASSYMGILAESISSVAATEEQQRLLFSHYPQILVFQCATNELAEPFSKNCGSYRRQEVQRNHTRHWKPLQLFPTHGVGKVVVHEVERNVRTEELTKLGTGVLLMGKQYKPPELIAYVQNNRGNLNGLFV